MTLAQTSDLWTSGLRLTSPNEAAKTERARIMSPKQKVAAKLQKEPAQTASSKLFKLEKKVALPEPAPFCIERDDIKHMLNGVARVIEYGTNYVDKKGNYNPTVDPNQNFIISLAEGQFRNGLFSGFIR